MSARFRTAVWVLLLTIGLADRAFAQDRRPNVIWLVLDDASPALGAYGDPQAITPPMDRLAREGARFTRAFTHTPVCAPSRFGLVTGMYPTTAGAHHMRSLLINPPPTFMHLLRASGYFVAWPGKVDFNFDPGGLNALPEGAADSTAQWRNEPPPKQPFFAYLNLGVTHEAQVRGDAQLHARNTARLKPSEFHDPAKNAYTEQKPTMRVWRQLHAAGKLTGAPEAFFAPTKPPEELYDTDADPDEIHNLAADPKVRTILERMRGVLDKWITETKDLGDVPEEELVKRGILRAQRGGV